MDIDRCRLIRIPLDPDDAAVVALARPMPFEWSARFIEAPAMVLPEGAEPSELARALRDSGATSLELHRAFLREVIVEFRGVTLGGREATRDEILAALPEHLVFAIAKEIARGAEVSAEQGKG